jgi:hypothetical protein
MVQTFTLNSGIAPDFYVGNGTAFSMPNLPMVRPEAGANTTYKTLTANYTHIGPFQSGSTLTNYATTGFSFKRVTDIASTGALLLSTKGGSRGFASLSAAFNPNLAGTYRILRSY